MSLNTLYTPRIYIGNKEIGFNTFSVTNPGNNQINTCNISSEALRDGARLFNKEVKLYLNELDGCPLFRGIIKSVSTSDNNISIVAHDARVLLSGKDGIPINISDNNNFDGYSISQFLHHYINTYINTDKIYLGTDYVSDTDISTNMSEVRGMQNDIYSMITSTLQNKIDDTDIDNLGSYSIDVYDDGIKSQIIIKKEIPLSSTPSLTLSQLDGIKSIQYNRRMPPSYGINYTIDGKAGVYQHGNMPYGRINETGSSEFKNVSDATYGAMISILKQQDDNQEISITITRGFNIEVGAIVRLNVDDFDIRGNHRITTKNITFSKGNMSCTLGLNKKPITLKNYLE